MIENDQVVGYSDIYTATPALGTFHAIATDVEVAETLVNLACRKSIELRLSLTTCLYSMENGYVCVKNVSESPVYSILCRAGFCIRSVTRRMRWIDTEVKTPELPSKYFFTRFDQSCLPSLMSAYCAAWPHDYYMNEPLENVAESFTKGSAQNPILVKSEAHKVIGYVMASRTAVIEEIEEVSVHPDRRQRGIGEALVRTVIQNAGNRVIELTVLEDNPAIRLYERLGFQIHNEMIVFNRGTP